MLEPIPSHTNYYTCSSSFSSLRQYQDPITKKLVPLFYIQGPNTSFKALACLYNVLYGQNYTSIEPTIFRLQNTSAGYNSRLLKVTFEHEMPRSERRCINYLLSKYIDDAELHNKKNFKLNFPSRC